MQRSRQLFLPPWKRSVNYSLMEVGKAVKMRQADLVAGIILVAVGWFSCLAAPGGGPKAVRGRQPAWTALARSSSGYHAPTHAEASMRRRSKYISR
jgi:hypothetical protein